MFNKILVPLDGSELAAAALEPALALAKDGDQLLLLSVPVPNYVMVPEPSNYGFVMLQDAVDQTHRLLVDYLQTVKQQIHRPLQIETAVIDGEAAGVIVDTARDRESDLIVMTTHGYSGFTRWIMGSVTEKVLHQAPCPVLVMRQEQIGHIMITLDGSTLSETALLPGLELARRLGARVTLFRVEPEFDFVDERSLDGLDIFEPGLGRHVRAALEVEPAQYLDNLIEEHAGPDLNVRSLTIRGKAAERIMDAVEAEAIDLVVMATHGRTGLRRWVYGSVTEKVLRQAKCSLLVVRPPGLN